MDDNYHLKLQLTHELQSTLRLTKLNNELLEILVQTIEQYRDLIHDPKMIRRIEHISYLLNQIYPELPDENYRQEDSDDNLTEPR